MVEIRFLSYSHSDSVEIEVRWRLTGTRMLCWGHCVRAWIDKSVTTWQHEGFYFFFFLLCFLPEKIFSFTCPFPIKMLLLWNSNELMWASHTWSLPGLTFLQVWLFPSEFSHPGPGWPVCPKLLSHRSVRMPQQHLETASIWDISVTY